MPVSVMTQRGRFVLRHFSLIGPAHGIKIACQWGLPPMVSFFELFQGAAQLVGAGSAFAAAVYAVKAGYYIVYFLTGYKAAYSLQVAVAAAQERYLLDYVVVIGHYVYQ